MLPENVSRCSLPAWYTFPLDTFRTDSFTAFRFCQLPLSQWDLFKSHKPSKSPLSGTSALFSCFVPLLHPYRPPHAVEFIGLAKKFIQGFHNMLPKIQTNILANPILIEYKNCLSPAPLLLCKLLEGGFSFCFVCLFQLYIDESQVPPIMAGTCC